MRKLIKYLMKLYGLNEEVKKTKIVSVPKYVEGVTEEQWKRVFGTPRPSDYNQYLYLEVEDKSPIELLKDERSVATKA